MQAIGSGVDHLESGMVEQQAQGALAGVAGGTEDGDGDLLAHGRAMMGAPAAGPVPLDAPIVRRVDPGIFPA